nr:M48 family metallopeptidase [Candidatus Gracilibacteria bacterium]
MDFQVKYSKIKHGYVRLGDDGILKLSIPIRFKNDKNFEKILLEKGKVLIEKLNKKNHQKIECFSDDFVVIFGENQVCEGKICEKVLKQKLYDFSLPILNKYSLDLGISFQKLTIKTLKSKRGSCTHDQKIVLNSKLLHIPYKFLEYVVIHEVCHLKEKNHSYKFWKLVEGFCPDYKDIRKELRKYKI